jgi:hypothetical protein
MAYSVRNIIVGAAAVFISSGDSTEVDWDGGPALPAFTTTAFAALNASADWRHQGFTSEGIEVSYEPEYGEVEVDQLLDAAKLFKQSMTVSVNTTLVEATLENLLVAWGQQGDSLSGDTLSISAGELGDEPVERALAFVGPGPRSGTGEKRERVYHVRRALSVESSSFALRRNEATVFPVSFRLLPDPNFTGAEYGVVIDRVVS